MKNRIRLLAGAVTLAGAALLGSPDSAYATMSRDRFDPLGTRFCCGWDANGDGRAEGYCCFANGCAAGPGGCQRRG